MDRCNNHLTGTGKWGEIDMMKSKQIQRPQMVLVVDDQEINRDVLEMILEDDYEVITAENGEEALARIREHSRELSIVLLDLMMPVMNGYEFLKAVRVDEELSKIPVIVLTAYILLSLLAVRALPEGCASWADYIANRGQYSGNASLPTFFAANTAMGNAGTFLLGIAALGAIFTGLIGNYIALSRLLCSLAEDELFPAWFGQKTAGFVPKNALLSILVISLLLPFFGRTTISWIVDVTTVGATIAYALASASAWKISRRNKETKQAVIALAGVVISVLFALEFLVPNLLSISTLSMESYLILTI